MLGARVKQIFNRIPASTARQKKTTTAVVKHDKTSG